jgi:hypothetical protein
MICAPFKKQSSGSFSVRRLCHIQGRLSNHLLDFSDGFGYTLFETRTAITRITRIVKSLSGIARDGEVTGIKRVVNAWNRMIIRRNGPQP